VRLGIGRRYPFGPAGDPPFAAPELTARKARVPLAGLGVRRRW
jgi:hypothetical protein